MLQYDNDDQTSESMTLEQAQVELARLRAFQRAAYHFLPIFCNYDIRPAFTGILHNLPILIEAESLTDDQRRVLAILLRQAEQLMKTIWLIIVATGNERGHDPVTSEKLYSPEYTDLRPILTESVTLAREKVEYDNSLRSDLLEMEKHQGRLIVAQAREPIEFATVIPEYLPAVWGNVAILKDVISNVTWFITSHHLMTKVFFNVDADSRGLHIQVGCHAFYTRPSALNDFQHFETAATFLMFNTESLYLYNSWQALQQSGGAMQFAIEESPDRGKPSKSTVTILLQAQQ